MKRLSLAASIWLCTLDISAQTEDVTKKYLENPDFEARFAAWVNPGKFTYIDTRNTANMSKKRWLSILHIPYIIYTRDKLRCKFQIKAISL